MMAQNALKRASAGHGLIPTTRRLRASQMQRHHHSADAMRPASGIPNHPPTPLMPEVATASSSRLCGAHKMSSGSVIDRHGEVSGQLINVVGSHVRAIHWGFDASRSYNLATSIASFSSC